MKVQILGSSSSGNCYLFKAKNETLILEAGVRFSEVKKALNFDLSSVIGCCITHEHGDHSRALADFLNSGIRVLALPEVFASHNISSLAFRKEIKSGKGYKIGSFKIVVLEVSHDVPCVAFILMHEECGTVLFATDTAFFDYKIDGLNHIFIECNYADDILTENIENGKLPVSMGRRLHCSHMELQTTKNVLRSTDLSKTTDICLLHLSGNNSDADRFRSEIAALTGLPTTIARKGMELEIFNNQPF